MVQVFLKLWKEVDGNPRNSNELILLIHENEEMLIKIRESFWNSIDKRIGIHDSMKKLVKFAYSAYFVDFDRSDESILKIPGKDKIFKLFLDDTVDFSHIRRMSGYDPMLKLTSNSNFCWFTTYTILPSLQTLLRPFSLLEIKDDAIHEICQYACLTDTLRFTASIHDLTDAVLSSISTHRYLQWDDLRTRVEIINGYNGYKSGTRVVGVPCDLYQVQSHSDMVDKVVAIVEAYITTGKFRIDDIAVIKISEYFDTVNMTIEEITNITDKKEEKFVPSLRQRLKPILNDKFWRFKDNIQSPSRLRGREMECVIVCVLESLSSPENVEDIQAIQAFQVLEAITRANSAVTVFYLEGNQQIKTVHENLQNKMPSISPSNIYRKQNSSVMRKHQPQKLMSFLIDDAVQVMTIFFRFHTAYHTIIGQEKLWPVCDLRCVGHLKSNMRFEVSSTVVTAFWDLFYLTLLTGQINILIGKSENTHCSDTLKILLK
ncbi:hypothetical protein QYM36_009875 [Artemia franciscana]|uniref:Uncharacterized protein n=3 Tax=Artemia franciscana TaxID=6661 RepID=A0AA88HVP0_ARTSF|nr:hypothetical protein QYM36_009875 [Artemia franciscana]